METKLFAAYMAGHCTEVTAWRLLRDVASQSVEQGFRVPVSPYSVCIDDDGGFCLTEPTVPSVEGFEAPEVLGDGLKTEASQVWALAATLFYVMMGCQIMNGKGGRGQHERSRIPYLRNELPELSELLQHCLHYNPARRPSMKAVLQQASTQYERCLSDISRGPRLKPADHPAVAMQQQKSLDTWPEQMVAVK